MLNRKARATALAGSVALACAIGPVGCSNGPLGKGSSGAAAEAGGGGALTGAVMSRAGGGTGMQAAQDAPALSNLGESSGWLIGAEPAKIDQKKDQEARAAEERARRQPATVDDVRRSESADLNGDGFVTLDEVEAMQKSGLSDRDMVDRLQRTGQVFQLNDRQQDHLKDRGVSQGVIDAMLSLTRRPTAPPTPLAAPGNGGAAPDQRDRS